MKIRLAFAMLLGSFVVGTTGCNIVDKTMNVFKPKPMIDRSPLDEEDEWADVGNDARGNQTRERDPDRWWKKYVMSEQANQIERNLGID